MPPIFSPCVKIVESGSASAGLACSWLIMKYIGYLIRNADLFKQRYVDDNQKSW